MDNNRRWEQGELTNVIENDFQIHVNLDLHPNAKPDGIVPALPRKAPSWSRG
jgi:hypothetical protein